MRKTTIGPLSPKTALPKPWMILLTYAVCLLFVGLTVRLFWVGLVQHAVGWLLVSSALLMWEAVIAVAEVRAWRRLR